MRTGPLLFQIFDLPISMDSCIVQWIGYGIKRNSESKLWSNVDTLMLLTFFFYSWYTTILPFLLAQFYTCTRIMPCFGGLIEQSGYLVFGWYWGKMRKLKKENSISEKMWDFCRGISITLFYPAHNAALIIFQGGSYFTQTNIIKQTKLSFLLKKYYFLISSWSMQFPPPCAMQCNGINRTIRNWNWRGEKPFVGKFSSIQNGFLIKVSPATSFSTF